MEKDFHLALTYVVARLAGFAHVEAQTVAIASQYVDDAVNQGTVHFKTGEEYRRISSAHENLNPRIFFASAERSVWVPFHFLPGAVAEDPREESHKGHAFYDRIICRPNSAPARQMLRSCIERCDRPYALHRLGITAHVFIDTWAHQGFAGVKHRINRATRIKLRTCTSRMRGLAHLKRVVKAQGVSQLISRVGYLILCQLLNFTFPMGHGTVLHYPDWPFLHWSYRNGHGETVVRDNPKDYLEAADELFRFFCRYRLRDPERSVPDIPAADRALIGQMIEGIQHEDGDLRCAEWLAAIAAGQFSFGPAQVEYFPKGKQSWKYQAMGDEGAADHFWERPAYTPAFLASDWKLFHDAALAHQFAMIHEVFPQFGICLI